MPFAVTNGGTFGYADGTEELYDMKADPHEWTNLAAMPAYKETMADHRRWLPKVDVAPAKGSAQRVLTYDRETDVATWEGKPIRRSDLVPE